MTALKRLADHFRERLGTLVREEWMAWAEERRTIDPDHWKPSWIAPWHELKEHEREVDRRIGEELYIEGYLRGYDDGRYDAEHGNEHSAPDWRGHD